MKNYRKSDYALNKFSEGIVYQFSDGTLEISMADYLRDNPDKTEADFLELKALSDEIYLEQVRLETAQGNKTVSMTELEDTIAHPAPSLDDSYIMADENRRIKLAVDKLFQYGKLTPKQKNGQGQSPPLRCSQRWLYHTPDDTGDSQAASQRL